MDFTKLVTWTKSLGNFLSEKLTWGVQKLSELGLNVNPTHVKIISVLALLIFSFIIIKMIEKPIKWAIVILSIILAVSFGVALIP